ncbi:GGDEF domain-containing protein [Longispora sp. NPDC051575]|uniref:GGDEF domain-containing protein n=1 Tax=Longispora sp. NPDC051575 TaxID=3154943 RepID=UPI003424231C
MGAPQGWVQLTTSGGVALVVVLVSWLWLAWRRERWLVDHDPLTDLLGLRGWRKALARARRRPLRRWARVECDIDAFKQVNDTHGHEAGDRVLCGVAVVLREVCGPWCARSGGDEFAALLPVPHDVTDPAAWAARIGAVLRARLHVAGQGWIGGQAVTVSVGVVLTNAADLAASRRAAELAMYSNKRRRYQHPAGGQQDGDLPAAA